MKRDVLLRVEESAYERFMAALSLCPAVEVVCEGGGTDPRTGADWCMVLAVGELRRRGVLRQPGDFAYIMQVCNERLEGDLSPFCSPQDFLTYLEALGVDGVPGRSTIYCVLNKMRGRFPGWTFTDKHSPAEALRRRNIGSQFLSAYTRARYHVSDVLAGCGQK